MHKYRTKSTVIEATWYDGSANSARAVLAWMNGPGNRLKNGAIGRGKSLVILSPQSPGKVIINPGDWIVRDARGKFAPMHRDIFTRTYEPAGS